VSTAKATDYRIETYDFPGAASSVITGINSAGRVIGVYILPNMTPTGPRGSLGFTVSNGTYTQIGDSTLCRPAGRCLVFISSINSWGVIAGTFSADVDFPGIFYQTTTGPRGFVQPPGYPNTEVLTLAGLNDLGEVGVQTLPFILRTGAYSTVILPVSGAVTVAGIDNFGRLFGLYDTHGFVATPAAN
jgi:hypothetical protein